MLDKLKKFLSDYILITLCLILIFALTRIVEYAFVAFAIHEDTTCDLFFTKSLNFDTLILLIYSGYALIPFFLVSLLNFKVYRVMNRCFLLILVILNLGLTQYFLTNNTLLTCQFFEFSAVEIKDIVFHEFTLNRLPFWIGVIFILSLTVYFLFQKKFMIKSKWLKSAIISYAIAIAIALVNIPYTFKELKYFNSNYEYLLGNSKMGYFIKSYFDAKDQKHAFDYFAPRDLKNKINDYCETRKDFQFPDKSFPFLHNEPYKNVLENYFPKSKTKPNIVMIISESLSSSFSGKHNLFGSLTPFTDSLMKESLSWSFFLSDANRSYGALPNILASAPTGVDQRGFINTVVEYPDHQKYPAHTSLIRLLKQNGYVTNYYYGGWGYFDNIGYYLKEQNIDHFICDEDFSQFKPTINKTPPHDGTWGYNDKELFKLSLNLFEKHTQHKPFLTIYQTISNHSPYNLSEESYYDDAYLAKKLASLKIDQTIYEKIDKKIISSVFFSDDALQLYFENIKKRPGFDNTIFIITGDHSIGLSSDKNPFKNYWVPLIIYSPLLKKPAEFNGLCSHLDILPSLLALLQENFSLSFPQEKSWVGTGLDTSARFNANRFIPLNIVAMDIPNFVINQQVLYGNEIFRLDSTLNLSQETDNQKAETVLKQIKTYSYLNSYVCLKNKIWHY